MACSASVRRDMWRIVFAGMTAILLLAGARSTAAQTITFGAIEGTVTDETGGALPGVSVTLTSPVLQVPRISTVTDAEGRYRFPDLRVGTYRVEYGLQGFQTVIRENVLLSTGFVARVDAVLKVGAVEETVTVSGASPVVDLTTTRGGQTIATELASRVMPLAGMGADLVRLTPGLDLPLRNRNPGAMGARTAGAMSAYGQAGATSLVEGFEMHNFVWWSNLSDTEEMDVRTFGNTAEFGKPGSVMNLVFRSGGNTFHGLFAGEFMHRALQGSNLDSPVLRAQGFTQPENLQNYYDLHGSVSGRIVRDRLWFFASGRQRKSEKLLGGFQANAGPDGEYLTGDEPTAPERIQQDAQVAKLSYQVSSAYRLSAFYWRDMTRDSPLPFSGILGGGNQRTITLDYSTRYTHPIHIYTGEFRGTPTKSLAFETNVGYTDYNSNYHLQDGCSGPAKFDRSTSLYTGCSIGPGNVSTSERYSLSNWYSYFGNVTYVRTGFLSDHTFKVGSRGTFTVVGVTVPDHPFGNYILIFDTIAGVKRRPAEIETFGLPADPRQRHNLFSAYATDQWRIARRVTANLGVRFERQHLFIPPGRREASTFSTAQSFPEIEVGDWNLWAPRAAVAWDLAGTGKTVVKATYGWFNNDLPYSPQSFADIYNPATTARTRYRWNDANGNNDYDPGEVDLSLNGRDFLSFSGASASNTRPLRPDFKVPHTHEVTAVLERELIPNMAGRLLYVYKRFVNNYDEINAGRPYSAFNIPLPRRDPGPDGIVNTPDDGPMVTIYDYDPAYAGGRFAINERVNRPDSQADVAQTLEASVTKRMSNGWTLGSSYGATKQHRWLVGTIENPNQEYFDIDRTWSHVFRLNGGYELPYGIIAGATLQVQSGVPGQRTYVFRAADPLGGPPLRQQTTVTLRLEPFGASRGPAFKELNMRAGKTFRQASQEFQVNIDVLNVLNSNAAQSQTYVAGPTFGQIVQIPSPRIAQFTVQYKF